VSSHGGELLLALFPYVTTILVLVGLLDEVSPPPLRRAARGGQASKSTSGFGFPLRLSTSSAICSTMSSSKATRA
jgi:hypothetical protein